MHITIYFGFGESVVLRNVQFIQLIGPGTLEVATFGNDPVIHRGVTGCEVATFTFAAAGSTETR